MGNGGCGGATALDIVQQLQQEGRLPDQLVIHLGTNGPISQTDMDAMMAATTEVPRVLLLTNKVDRDYTAGNNALIYATANAYSNVELLDWEGWTASCPGDCFYGDGIHLKPDGMVFYAELIQESFDG